MWQRKPTLGLNLQVIVIRIRNRNSCANQSSWLEQFGALCLTSICKPSHLTVPSDVIMGPLLVQDHWQNWDELTEVDEFKLIWKSSIFSRLASILKAAPIFFCLSFAVHAHCVQPLWEPKNFWVKRKTNLFSLFLCFHYFFFSFPNRSSSVLNVYQITILILIGNLAQPKMIIQEPVQVGELCSVQAASESGDFEWFDCELASSEECNCFPVYTVRDPKPECRRLSASIRLWIANYVGLASIGCRFICVQRNALRVSV